MLHLCRHGVMMLKTACRPMTLLSISLPCSPVTRDCNPGIDPANPKSRDWQCPNPGILRLQKFLK